MLKRTIFEDAEAVFKKRCDQNGLPKETITKIASMWSDYLNVELDAEDVCMLQALAKICRHSVKRKDDNKLDVCGYMRCIDDMDMMSKPRTATQVKAFRETKGVGHES